ncbi:hypothetical protein HAX54_034724, partial [Datura stramonium]|nr:hypothetical protein [Datura stramonium]
MPRPRDKQCGAATTPALQVVRCAADLALGQARGTHLPHTMAGGQQALSQHNKARATALSPGDGACNAALDATVAGGDATSVSNGPKMDLPLQLGKGTLSP